MSASPATNFFESQLHTLWLQRTELQLELAGTGAEPTRPQQARLAALDKAIADADDRVSKDKLSAPAPSPSRNSSKDYFRPPDLDKYPHFRCNPELPAFPLAQYLHTIGTDLMSSGGYTCSDLPRCLSVCLSQCSHATRHWYLSHVLPQALQLSADGRTELAWAYCKDQLMAKFPQPDQYLVCLVILKHPLLLLPL